MKGRTYSRNSIMELQEERKQHRKFYRQDFGGQQFSRMQNHMLDFVTFINGWENHHTGMNYHFNRLELYRHLKNG
jgi:hypothetical protein